MWVALLTLANSFDTRSISSFEETFYDPPLAMWRRNYQPLPQDKSEEYRNDTERWEPSTIFILLAWHLAPS